MDGNYHCVLLFWNSGVEAVNLHVAHFTSQDHHGSHYSVSAGYTSTTSSQTGTPVDLIPLSF